MVKTGFKSVDEYIASQPEAVQNVLERVRSTICKAVPGTEEVISYQIPTYKMNGRPVLHFAGWRQHYSLYPSNDRLVAAFKDALAPYEVNKGTIRFPLDAPLPETLVKTLVSERIAAIEAAAVARKRKRSGSGRDG